MIFRSRKSASFWLDPEQADDTGLVAIGGDLSAPRLLEVYQQGEVVARIGKQK